MEHVKTHSDKVFGKGFSIEVCLSTYSHGHLPASQRFLKVDSDATSWMYRLCVFAGRTWLKRSFSLPYISSIQQIIWSGHICWPFIYLGSLTGETGPYLIATDNGNKKYLFSVFFIIFWLCCGHVVALHAQVVVITCAHGSFTWACDNNLVSTW